jgi:N-acetylglucosamine malate deacetylase 1
MEDVRERWNGAGVVTFCILAHQDDEVAMGPRISERVRSGGQVHCVFLTDGGAGRTRPNRRNAESLRALTSLGVSVQNVSFLGERAGIRDGHLVGQLDKAFQILKEATVTAQPMEVLCPAWEGGHPDHDASHLLALALAVQWRCLDSVWAYSIYNGHRTWGTFFRVAHRLPGFAEGGDWKLSFREGVRQALLCRFFPSQWRSWLGLFPELAWRVVGQRRLVEIRGSLDVIRRRPHDGSLYYERRFGMTYEAFRKLSDRFIREKIFLEPITAVQDRRDLGAVGAKSQGI